MVFSALENFSLNLNAYYDNERRLTLQGNYAWYRGKQFYDNDELQQYNASNLYNLQNNYCTADVIFNSGKFRSNY